MTVSFRGKLYSGEASSSRDITAHVNDSGYLVVNDSGLPPIHLRDISISPRVGNSTRYLDLPEGGKIETRANDEIDALQTFWVSSQAGFVHKLETSKRAILFSVLALVFGMYAFFVYGIPTLGSSITASLPTSLDDRLGGEVLEQLDAIVFEPSTLPISRQSELSELFESLIPDSERNYRINYRSGDFIGANAFALPNAQIIFTDQLVELSDDDAMMAAIMLHEIGHIFERHAMQSVVRQAGLSMAVFALTGDVNSAATTLIILLPTFLIQSQYSRTLEWEADSYALEQMLEKGIDTNKFADIMEKLLVSQGLEENSEADSEEEPFLQYFSTHPASDIRIERFRNAATNLD